MKTYKFFQQYSWGPGWNGEMNLPDSAVFYNIYPDEKFQEWYILIPNEDFDPVTIDKGIGCVQINYYQLMNYIIVHAKNIVADNWSDVGKEEFDSLFDKLFSNVYVYRYKKALYYVDTNINSIDFDDQIHLASPETLLACYRIKSLYSDAEVHCTRVNLKERLNLEDECFVDTCELRLCDIEPDVPDFFETHIKNIVSDDSKLYKESWDIVIKKLL